MYINTFTYVGFTSKHLYMRIYTTSIIFNTHKAAYISKYPYPHAHIYTYLQLYTSMTECTQVYFCMRIHTYAGHRLERTPNRQNNTDKPAWAATKPSNLHCKSNASISAR